jgi:propanol-preferring alcohol dehydrogenase
VGSRLFLTIFCRPRLTGSSIDAEDTLTFSSLQNIRPMIETVPLAEAAEAYGSMMRNEARFRIVVVTGQ